MNPSDVRAAIYCRISLAAIGDTTKTDDQERICRELAGRLGWEAGPVYTDHSRSAWKRNRKRPAWDAMLADVDAGRVGAIIVYHGDRLIRQPWDLELLLNLAESKGIRLASPTGVRSLDSADDRFILRIEAAQACRASDDTSRRKKAQYERMRRAGRTRPGGRGGRALGFESDGITHRQDEAQALREAAALILAGHSVRSVLIRLTDAGLRSTAGLQMSQSSFTRSLTSPRTAGLMPDGISPAAWLPVLDRETHEQLLAVTGRGVNARAGRGALCLLAGIAVCGQCGHAMYSGGTQYEKGGPRIRQYRCPGCGGVKRNMDLLDAYVTARVVARLGLDANPEGRAPELPGLAAEFAALTDALREIDDAIADPARAGLTALLARRDSAVKRLGELRDLAAGDARSRLRAAHAGISEEEFAALDLPVRRALTAACYRITVLPASKRGPGFRTQDVAMTPL